MKFLRKVIELRREDSNHTSNERMQICWRGCLLNRKDCTKSSLNKLPQFRMWLCNRKEVARMKCICFERKGDGKMISFVNGRKILEQCSLRL